MGSASRVGLQICIWFAASQHHSCRGQVAALGWFRCNRRFQPSFAAVLRHAQRSVVIDSKRPTHRSVTLVARVVMVGS